MSKLALLTIGILFLSTQTYSQVTKSENDKYTKINKGKVFIYWGGNRANYSKSDINFRGNGYNFTLNNIVAETNPRAII